MGTMTVSIVDDKHLWEQIAPNFIYNRLDLTESDPILLKIEENKCNKFIAACNNNHACSVGCWGMKLDNNEVNQISQYLFQYYDAYSIKFMKAVVEVDSIKGTECKVENDFIVELPPNIEQIDKRHSRKGKYNLNRSKRLAEESYGDISLTEIPAENPDDFLNSITRYFRLKNITHGVDYGMTEEDYASKYYVSHVYSLKFGDIETALVLSCEQCPCVYLENLTYDKNFARFSPGYIAYDLFIKRLVEKRKCSLYLGGGDYDYKKKYDSVEREVASFIIRNPSITAKIGSIPRIVYGGVLQIRGFVPGGIKKKLKEIIRR